MRKFIMFFFILIGTILFYFNYSIVNAESDNVIRLKYDDHYDITNKTVEIIDSGDPTSYKVGYSIDELTLKDDKVVTIENNYLVAKGIGTATIKIDDEIFEVKVETATISLLLLIGQSNMRGSEGDPNQSIVCPTGMVYSTYGDDRGATNTQLTKDNAAMFAPSALTGDYSYINTVGTTDCLEGYPLNSLTKEGEGRMGPDSGFAYEWVKQTNEKVWVVNAAHGGTSITTWQKNKENYTEAVNLFKACQETLQKEINAGHFKLSHMGYFWCQGCNDASKSAEWYVNNYLSMHENLKKDLAFNDLEFEFAGIIPVRAGNESYISYREGVQTNTTNKKYYECFKDLRMTGPRVAQYWMTSNPELEDIWNVCNIGEKWVWMPDGTNGVADYFNQHYKDGIVDYTTQVKQKDSWYKPTTPAAVHDSIHYNQIGYNEIGRESVRNILIILNEIEVEEKEIEVELVGWDGFSSVDSVSSSKNPNSQTLVVPIVYPVYKSKELNIELDENIKWNYYDIISTDPSTASTLKVNDKVVNIKEGEKYTHFKEHLSELPQDLCCGINLWQLLEHDKYYFASGTNWGIYSGGEVPSVTILVNPNDKIYASSFDKAGINGHATSNGIRTTFFSDYGIAKTLSPTETYNEFKKNGGYLIAPEGAVAINIAMWSNSDEWEIYLLNYEHNEINGECSICNKHYHDFSEWEITTLPTADKACEVTRICSTCNEIETKELLGFWQTNGISKYYQTLPDDVCSNLNLWSVLEHNDVYYKPTAESFGYHTTHNTTSVTFTIKPGDMIFATSFQKAGLNGHNSSSGIRLTFFGIDGVVITMDPSQTYNEFVSNGGYVIAPKDCIAVNVVMWNDSLDNEIYLLNYECSEVVEEGIEATCTTNGLTEKRYCEICNKVYLEQEVVPMLGHELTEWETLISPTCDTQGKDIRTCNNCDYEEYRYTYVTGDENKILVSNPVDKSKYNGKTLLLLGDSITCGVGVDDKANEIYGNIVAKELGMNVVNKAISGSGYCTDGRMFANNTLTVQNVKNADIITILLGINDFNWAVKDGSWNGKPNYYNKDDTYYQLGDYDSTETIYFYAAVRAWCEKIVEMKEIEGFKDKEFIVLTPMISSWNASATSKKDWDQSKVNVHGHTLREYCMAIMQVCAEYDIPVFDSNMFSGIYYNSSTDNNIGLTGGDGVHVNKYGHQLLAQNLTEFILGGYQYQTIDYKTSVHNFKQEVSNSSCTETGYIKHICLDCHYVTIEESNEIGHNYIITEQVDSTCTTTGYIKYTCSNDETHTYTTIIELKVHTTTKVIANKVEATCENKGSYDEVEYCSSCNTELNRESKEIEPLQHNYTEVVTKPTCEKEGYTTHTCSKCNDSYVDTITPALNHNYIQTEQVDSTCTTTGYIKYTCSNDETHTYTTTIELKEHTTTKVIENKVEATCENKGSYDEVEYCSSCSIELSRVTKVLEPLQHNYTEVVTKPTCEKEGYTTHTCNRCSDSYVDSTTPIVDHKYSDNGLGEYICSYCGTIKVNLDQFGCSGSVVPTVLGVAILLIIAIIMKKNKRKC